MAEKKLTKVTKFNAIKNELARVGITHITVEGIEFSVDEFCDREVELISNKKSTKKSVDNSPYFEEMRNALAGGGKSPTELVSLIGVTNTQKVVAIAKAMGNEIVTEKKGKKTTYFLA